MKYIKYVNWLIAIALVVFLVYAGVVMSGESEKMDRDIKIPRTWKETGQ